MTDKEKIRKEVERLRNLHQIKYQNLDTNDNMCLVECGKRNLCNALLLFIDSLQEEPVSRTPADIESAMQEVEEKSRAFTEAHQGESSDEILAQMRGEEPVSENLEQTSADYARERLSYDDYPTYNDEYELMLAYEAGAKWQKEQLIDKATEWLKSYRQDTPDGTGYIAGIVNDKTIEDFRRAMEK